MSDLDRVLYWHGVAPGYDNYRGEAVSVSLENRKSLLRTMDVDISSAEAISKAAYELDVAPWNKWFPPLIITENSEQSVFYINLTPADLPEKFTWVLKDTRGKEVQSGSFTPENCREIGNYHYDEIRFTRREVELEPMAVGYYQLEVKTSGATASTTLASVPVTSYQPEWTDSGEKLWGFIVQLYTLRSERNWGVGDFSDLSLLIDKAAAAGADVIGLNPLHALLPDVDRYCSPYSPSDRRFVNPLYIDIELEADFLGSPELVARYRSPQVQDEIAQLRSAALVNYVEVKALKYPCFDAMYQRFCETELAHHSERARRFENYLNERGASLNQYALYELVKNSASDDRYLADVTDEVLFAGRGAAFDQAVADNREGVRFYAYLQWLADEQLEKCQHKAESLGMKVGLIRDLAVGADGDGSEVSLNQQLFCRGASVGAPPDPLAEQGQNWGLPPMDPAELRRSGFKHFIELLRANMGLCGALRIDHAMSLMRLWWCPPGKTADYGAYVYYPFEELLGLLKLESHLNRCVVVGEDLGVVPGEFRDALGKAKVFTNKVFYFEKNANKFKAPQEYDAHALAMVNNHDVPTLASWWDSIDLEFRGKFNLLEEGVSYEQICAQRVIEKQEAVNLLEEQGLMPDSWRDKGLDAPADRDIVFAILKLTSRVNSRIYVLQLEDLLLIKEPVNIPGTFEEYENWKRKQTTTVDAIFNDSDIAALLAEINSERKIKMRR